MGATERTTSAQTTEEEEEEDEDEDEEEENVTCAQKLFTDSSPHPRPPQLSPLTVRSPIRAHCAVSFTLGDTDEVTPAQRVSGV